MNICICDDNLIFAKHLGQMVSLAFEKLGIFPKIVCCKSKDEVMEFSKTKKFDVLFLDIELDDDNGIILANEYYSLYGDTKIIFVTSYADKYSQAIFLSSATFKPFGFVIKPAQASIVNDLCRLLASTTELDGNLHYTIISNGSKIDLNQKDIMYAESFGRQFTFYLKSGDSFVSYKKLSDVETELGAKFIRCHRSYVINLDYIQLIDEKNSTARLYNGAILIISKKRLSDVKKKYFAHKGGI